MLMLLDCGLSALCICDMQELSQFCSSSSRPFSKPKYETDQSPNPEAPVASSSAAAPPHAHRVKLSISCDGEQTWLVTGGTGNNIKSAQQEASQQMLHKPAILPFLRQWYTVLFKSLVCSAQAGSAAPGSSKMQVIESKVKLIENLIVEVGTQLKGATAQQSA